MRIALGIEYDGSGFSGWQMQSGGMRTVQGELEKALSKLANETVRVVCAGRTDTGVHATGQVVHFDTTAVRNTKAWVSGVNTYLPDDVASLWSVEVSDDFSARFSATARQYRYVILNRQGRAAVFNCKVAWRHGAINVQRMHEAAQVLLREQDFTSFRSSSCQARHARRDIHYINVSRKGDFIYIDIKANAFLHHMVRNIAGSLLMIGQGERPVNWMQTLLQAKDRAQAGPTASAKGLYMVKVSYPEEFNLPDYCYLPEFT
jgi:tRNA pseudouridine38-40 synthase